MDSAVLSGLIGLAAASLPVGFSAYFSKRKTKAEEDDLVTQATDRLIKIYDKRDQELENKISKLEESVRVANFRANEAEKRELACTTRLTTLQHKFDDLQVQVDELKRRK